MRLIDSMTFPVVALWQQLGRTVLATLGVMFGAFVLAASISINQGVQETIDRESRKTDALRRISVHVRWNHSKLNTSEENVVVDGAMSEEKRKRIRTAIAQESQHKSSANTRVLLTPEMLSRIGAIDHVERIEPEIRFHDFVKLNGQTVPTNLESTSPDSSVYERRIVAGQFYKAADEPSALVSEYLLYRCGIADDAAVQALIGSKLIIELHPRQIPHRAPLAFFLTRLDGRPTTPAEVELIGRLNRQMSEFIKNSALSPEDRETLKWALDSPSQQAETADQEVITQEFKICGVIRQLAAEEVSQRQWWEDLGGVSDVFLPYKTCEEFFFRSAENRHIGLDRMLLIAENEQYVKEIVRQVKEMGLNAHAPIEFIERERLIWRLVFGGMTCVAAVALLVAAMGIANTMLMSVLERTREIGIMKSVGASQADIQMIFLVEGSLIGFAGGSLGVVLAWAAAIPGDAWVRSMVERDINVKLHDALFTFPLWLIVTVMAFSVFVSTAAAVYPAHRASSVDPVAALRYE